MTLDPIGRCTDDKAYLVSPERVIFTLGVRSDTAQDGGGVVSFPVCVLTSSDASLPAGTLLPKGCAFAMQATVDFGLHFPVRG